MAQTIKLKRSATSGGKPSTGSLALGEVAINTYDGKMYIKKSVGGTETIVEVGGGGTLWKQYVYTSTSSQSTFSGSDDNSSTLSYMAEYLEVYYNGILLDPAVDYTATTGTTVVLTVAAATGDLIQIDTFSSVLGTGDTVLDTFTGVTNQTDFTLSTDPGSENNTNVFVNAVYQTKDTYSTAGTTLTFGSAPSAGDDIEVSIGSRNVSFTETGTVSLGGALSVAGNIAVTGTVDGRDVATDGTKLDTIETSATADQTGAQIKTAYEAETNAFTDTQFTKLGGIETLADVTDATNVTAAGALMDSELTDIAAVKALDQGVATTDSPTFAGVTATTYTGLPATSETVSGTVELATQVEVDAGTDTTRAITAATLTNFAGFPASSATEATITQTAHGLAVLDCVRYNGTSWVKAKADAGTTTALGVVVEVIDVNSFMYAIAGRYTITHGLTVDEWYYLDDVTAGGLTSTAPTIEQPLVYVDDSTHVSVYPYRPSSDTLAASAATESTITQASHGLSVLDCVRYNGTSWVKAQADATTTTALGVVVEVVDVNNFVYSIAGRYTITHGLTVDEWYYLSAATAGGLTATAPAIEQPIVYTEDSTHFSVYAYRPSSDVAPTAASETVSGVIELATQAEVDAGTDAVRAVTPATLSSFLPFTATGGTITYSGAYTIHTFTTSGTFTPNRSGDVDYLVVAGGGSGGQGDSTSFAGERGGGGGAGGYRTSVTGQTSGGGASAESAKAVIPIAYTVTIGAGGAGPSGDNGGDSVFSTITSIGGGGGAYFPLEALPASYMGRAGGSSGGNHRDIAGTSHGAATANQGYEGGMSNSGLTYAGGGGGAGGVGADNITSGGGGAGVSSTISGSTVTRAEGGDVLSTTAGGANTGSGGGGGTNDTTNGAAGGSGIVIVRYLT